MSDPMTMTDSRTLAYINMFGILGAIENLCDLAPEAKDILKKIFSRNA